MGRLPEKREPTHVLRVEVPLHLDGYPDEGFDAVMDAIRLSIAVSRAAFVGRVCGDPMVNLKTQREIG